MFSHSLCVRIMRVRQRFSVVSVRERFCAFSRLTDMHRYDLYTGRLKWKIWNVIKVKYWSSYLSIVSQGILNEKRFYSILLYLNGYIQYLPIQQAQHFLWSLGLVIFWGVIFCKTLTKLNILGIKPLISYLHLPVISSFQNSHTYKWKLSALLINFNPQVFF